LTKRNVSLLFSRELNIVHRDALLEVEEKEKLSFWTKLAKLTFYKQALAKTFYLDRNRKLLFYEIQDRGINLAVFLELFQGEVFLMKLVFF
jgi:hypothetical protein